MPVPIRLFLCLRLCLCSGSSHKWAPGWGVSKTRTRVSFLIIIFLSFLCLFFFNPNVDFSWFASAVHHCYFFAYKGNEIKRSSFVRDITANHSRHISVNTVEYRSCANFFFSSAPIYYCRKQRDKTFCFVLFCFLTL